MTHAPANRLRLIPFALVILLFALGLKHYYSHAGTGDLIWILGPTAGLVESLTGLAFDLEVGTGFVNRAHRLIIAPSCAGINFLITVFCMASFAGISRFSRTATRTAWMFGSIGGAFAATIGVNAVRIAASYHLYNAKIYTGWLTPERVHRAGGVVIYFISLSVLYLILTKIIAYLSSGRPRLRPANAPTVPAAAKVLHMGAVPVAWYLAATIAAPFLNAAFRKGNGQFIEHCLTTAVTCLTLFILITLIRLSFYRFADKVNRNRILWR